MAMPLESISLIVRRDRIESLLLPGGWPQYRAEFGEPFAGWMDDDLIRFGAMNDIQHYSNIAFLKGLGLRMEGRRKGRTVFIDMTPAPLHEHEDMCDWLFVDDDYRAHFVGKREAPKRPKVQSPWEDAAWKQTMVVLREDLARSSGPSGCWLRHFDGRSGKIRYQTERPRGFVVETADGASERYKLIEQVLNAGWVL